MLKFRRQVVQMVLNHCKKEAPYEACGYLAERSGIILCHYELTNVDKSEVHFSMDPGEQFAAVRHMRANGIKLRAVYHSHPKTPAHPSREDVRLAHDAGLSYVIVSLLDDSLNSFRMENAGFEREDIEIIEEKPDEPFA